MPSSARALIRCSQPVPSDSAVTLAKLSEILPSGADASSDCPICRVEQAQGALANVDPKVERGMVLPFKPLNLTFQHVNYFVDPPAVRRALCRITDISVIGTASVW